MPYELRTFGGLDLRGPDGSAVEPMLAHAKGMALLAYLAVEGRGDPVPRSEVAALLWPERPEDRAQNALRITLTRIRQDGDPKLVEGKRQPTLRLNPAFVDVDVRGFEEAIESGRPQAALELYRGHFLAGFGLEGASPFHRWADETRERFRDRAWRAALALGSEARERGELASATGAFRRALRLRPLREDAVAGLLRSLADEGRAAEALQVYERFRERRREELDLPVSEELEELIERIRSGEWEAREDRMPPPAEAPPSKEEGAGGEQVPPAPGSGRWRRRKLLASALAVAVLGAVALWGGIDGAGETGGVRSDRSIAVLPFRAIGTSDSPVFAEGLHSDLLTRLSNVGGVDVTSSTSVRRFRESDLPLPEIADTLGVRWVLEGEVQQVGDRLSVNVQLIDPRTDTHAWARSFRRELTAESYFGLQDEIAGHVVDVLEGRLGGEVAWNRPRSRPTESLDAYRFYVRGRSLLEQRDPPQMQKSLEYFDQALATDSSYALAWAGRANALSILARYPGFGPDTLLPRADTAVRRALELDTELSEAHAARGRLHMYRREGPAALEAFRHAIELRPSFAEAWAWLAKLQLSLGMAEEALRSAERGATTDPLSVENLGTLVFAQLANDRPEAALRTARRIASFDRDGGFTYRRVVLLHQGRIGDLRSLYREHEREAAESWPYLQLLAADGDSAAARRLRSEADTTENTTLAAAHYASLGEPDRALQLFAEAYPRHRHPWDLFYSVHFRHLWRRMLGDVRELPGYDSLLREMNVTWGLNPDGSLPED